MEKGLKKSMKCFRRIEREMRKIICKVLGHKKYYYTFLGTIERKGILGRKTSAPVFLKKPSEKCIRCGEEVK